MRRAIEAGIEFLLSRDPAKANYPMGYASRPSGSWFKFGYPMGYVTDVLRNAEVLVALGQGRSAGAAETAVAAVLHPAHPADAGPQQSLPTAAAEQIVLTVHPTADPAEHRTASRQALRCRSLSYHDPRGIRRNSDRAFGASTPWRCGVAKAGDREAVYAREVRSERWLSVSVSAWLAGIAILLAGWLINAALLHTGLNLFDLVRPLP